MLTAGVRMLQILQTSGGPCKVFCIGGGLTRWAQEAEHTFPMYYCIYRFLSALILPPGG